MSDYTLVSWARDYLANPEPIRSADACRNYCFNHPDVKASLNGLRSEVEALRADLANMKALADSLDTDKAELERDRERLDWLVDAEVLCLCEWKGGEYVALPVGTHVRAAIDAAMGRGDR